VSVLSNAVPLLDEQGGVRGAVSIWADVTGLKEAEAEVRRLNADLERRVEERTHDLRRALEELSAYAYSIAHDLRAPLRAISGLTQLFVDENRDRLSPMSGDYARRITGAAQRMDQMILDLLKYARISREIYPVQEVDPHALCAESVQQLSGELHVRSGEAIVDGPMSRVLGHRELIRDVFDQLLSNAIKFVPAGIAPRIRVWSVEEEKELRILVEDNGIGIKPEYLEKIFGVFQKLQLQEDSPGTGIGLAIVRRAVERMGGSCGVESEVGRGSRFWIRLPKAMSRRSDASVKTTEQAYLKY
jgi:signal transduction histidine kinase